MPLSRDSASTVRVARGSAAAIASIVVVALTIQLVALGAGAPNANSGELEPAPSEGVAILRLFSYFTTASNLLVLATCLALIRDPRRDGRLWRVLRIDALLSVLVTGLVYTVLVAPLQLLDDWSLVATIGLHYLTPVAFLLQWLLLGPRPQVDWASLGRAFVWPVVWVAYTFVGGAVTGWYPYPFLDVGEIGLTQALGNTGIVLLLAVVLALLLKAADRLPALLSPRVLSVSPRPRPPRVRSAPALEG